MKSRRIHFGPIAIVAWVVAIGWIALAVWIFVGLEPSWATAAAWVASLAGLVTGWVAFSLRVVTDADGIRIPGEPKLAWDDVDSVLVRPGLLHLPMAVTHKGRGISEHPMEGLAAGRRTARKLAQRVADAGGLGTVEQLNQQSKRGAARRAAR